MPTSTATTDRARRGTAGGPGPTRDGEVIAPVTGIESAADRANWLADAALAGDRRALARLLTAVENATPVGEAATRRLYPLAGRAHLVGITGAPGSGKSTLVAALTAEARAAGRSVAVIAVDPSSPITGGAILGDRVRMQAHAGDRDVFIRSMASRGHAGGLAATSVAVATVLDAAGFDLIFVETVGTGQSEVEVAAAADTTVVLEAPEMGDEVQAIKAGLLEVADIVVVNKGDRPGAHRTASQLRAMLVASAPRDPSDGRQRPKRPMVLVTTAATGAGVPELLAALDRSRPAESAEEPAPARLARARTQISAVLQERVAARLGDPAHAAWTRDVTDEVANHRLDPYAAADRLLSELFPESGAAAGPGPGAGARRDDA